MKANEEVAKLTNVELENLKFTLRERINKDLFSRASFDIVEDVIMDTLTLELKVNVFAEHVGRNICEFPENWWQAFKDRWFPVWLKKLSPVRMTRFTVDVHCAYPHFVPAVDSESQFLKPCNECGPNIEFVFDY